MENLANLAVLYKDTEMSRKGCFICLKSRVKDLRSIPDDLTVILQSIEGVMGGKYDKCLYSYCTNCRMEYSKIKSKHDESNLVNVLCKGLLKKYYTRQVLFHII